jgi:hypothetical protein
VLNDSHWAVYEFKIHLMADFTTAKGQLLINKLIILNWKIRWKNVLTDQIGCGAFIQSKTSVCIEEISGSEADLPHDVAKSKFTSNHKTKNKTNSVALSPRVNYTDWATATCWRNLVSTFVYRRVSRGQRGGSRTVVNLSFLDRTSNHTGTKAKYFY